MKPIELIVTKKITMPLNCCPRDTKHHVDYGAPTNLSAIIKESIPFNQPLPPVGIPSKRRDFPVEKDSSLMLFSLESVGSSNLME